MIVHLWLMIYDLAYNRCISSLVHVPFIGIFLRCSFYWSDMSNPVIAAKIAKELRRFHEVEVPGPKEPQLWHAIFKFLEQGITLCVDNCFLSKLH